MLRRYAIANALFAFTRHLRPVIRSSLPGQGLSENSPPHDTPGAAPGVLSEATSERRSRDNATGDAPELHRIQVPDSMVQWVALTDVTNPYAA